MGAERWTWHAQGLVEPPGRHHRRSRVDEALSLLREMTDPYAGFGVADRKAKWDVLMKLAIPSTTDPGANANGGSRFGRSSITSRPS
jgi:hypothetical protein